MFLIVTQEGKRSGPYDPVDKARDRLINLLCAEWPLPPPTKTNSKTSIMPRWGGGSRTDLAQHSQKLLALSLAPPASHSLPSLKRKINP